jgi:hypothetical protein
MDADTPNRSATAPTFSASPIFLERGAFFLWAVFGAWEFVEDLDKVVSTGPSLGGIDLFAF